MFRVVVALMVSFFLSCTGAVVWGAVDSATLSAPVEGELFSHVDMRAYIESVLAADDDASYDSQLMAQQYMVLLLEDAVQGRIAIESDSSLHPDGVEDIVAFIEEVDALASLLAKRLEKSKLLFEAYVVSAYGLLLTFDGEVEEYHRNAVERIQERVSTAVHDIRTPISHMMSFSSLLVTNLEEQKLSGDWLPFYANVMRFHDDSNELFKQFSELSEKRKVFMEASEPRLDMILNMEVYLESFVSLYEDLVESLPSSCPVAGSVDAEVVEDATLFLNYLREALNNFVELLFDEFTPYVSMHGIHVEVSQPFISPALFLAQRRLMIQNAFEGEGVAVVSETADNLPLVAVRHVDMINIFGNFNTNLRDHAGFSTFNDPARKAVRLRGVYDESSDEVVINVEDTGNPIPERMMEIVDDAGVQKQRLFMMSESTHTGKSNSGIGMAHVYEIVTQAGGSIRAYNEHGWAGFEMRLPVYEEFVSSELLDGQFDIFVSA